MANYDYDDIAVSEEDFPLPTDSPIFHGARGITKPLESMRLSLSSLSNLWHRRQWMRPESEDSNLPLTLHSYPKDHPALSPHSEKAIEGMSPQTKTPGHDTAGHLPFQLFRHPSDPAEPPVRVDGAVGKFKKNQNAVDEFFADRIERWSGTE